MSGADEALLGVAGQDRSDASLQRLVRPAPSDVPQPHHGATAAQTTFNLVNVYMGIGLLSMPYAMRLSGWSGLATLAIAAAVFCASGKLIVKSFERLPDGPKSYARLGFAALGTTGKTLVLVFATLEFFGALCITLVIIYKQIESFLPDSGGLGLSPVQLSAAIATIALAPLLFVPSLRHLSHFSSLGVVSSFVVMAAVVAATVIDPHRTAAPLQTVPGHKAFHKDVLQGFGIFAVSVSGHSSLPAIRSSMAQPHHFGSVLSLSFAVMLLVYSSVAAFGYYYFGDITSQIITTDLALRAPFAGSFLLVPGLSVATIVNIFITCNACTKLPLLVVVLQDMVTGAVPSLTEGALAAPCTPYILRILVFSAATGVSFKAFDVLGILVSLTGGLCSMTCSLLLPALFFACLYWQEMKTFGRCGIVALLIFGMCMLVLIVAQNLQAMRSQLQGRQLEFLHFVT